MPENIDVHSFLEVFGLDFYLANPAVQLSMEGRGITNETLVTVIIDPILKNMQRSDFIMQKEYSVKVVFDQPKGKWQSALSNSVFLDSKKFF